MDGAACQTEEVFEAALEAMRAAGVELVPMDMDLVIQLGRKDLPDTLFYTYEYPRELSRCGHATYDMRTSRLAVLSCHTGSLGAALRC